MGTHLTGATPAVNGNGGATCFRAAPVWLRIELAAWLISVGWPVSQAARLMHLTTDHLYRCLGRSPRTYRRSDAQIDTLVQRVGPQRMREALDRLPKS